MGQGRAEILFEGKVGVSRLFGMGLRGFGDCWRRGFVVHRRIFVTCAAFPSNGPALAGV